MNEHSAVVTEISTDSRDDANENTLFVALVGEKFNGHNYIDDMYEKGARTFVVDSDEGYTKQSDGIYLKVENTLYSLAKIAKIYKNMFNAPIVGITGSSGKTTTKELIAHFLSTKYNTLKNKANLNNEIGVPKTLFELTNKHEIAAIEMGMNHKGEIARITNAAEPEVAVVTNVFPVHIEYFENIEAIAKAKAEIFTALKGRKVAIINADNDQTPILIEEAKLYANKIISYSLGEVEYDSASNTFAYKNLKFTNPLFGVFNVSNILAALKVAEEYNIPLEDCSRALKTFSLPKNRMETLSIENSTIINDTYNSNPQAMKEMLKELSKTDAEKRIAVIGDMLELGTHSDELHKEVGTFINTLENIKTVYTFGSHSEILLSTLDNDIEQKHFRTHNELSATLRTHTKEKTAILIKGSRGVALDKVVDALKS